ncbi:MAG: hypothetical protein K1X66_01160 [Verrucomicrobiae bacterium]|nr:hypothetical protein [Verrucomicrobiae bacterium]
MQVMVLGMHRSGTSVLGAILELLGLSWGKSEEGLPADQDNPRGYWERQDIVALNDFLLEGCESRWDKVSRFSLERLNTKDREIFYERAKEILGCFPSDAAYFIKDPRLCLTWREWLPLLSKPVGVFVYRDPLQVAQSLAKRNGMPLPVGLALWQFYWLHMVLALSRMPCFLVYHDELISKPVEVVYQLFHFFQNEGFSKLKLPEEKLILSLIDPSLFRHRESNESQMRLLNSEQVRLRQDFEQRKSIMDISFAELSECSWEWLKFYEETTSIRESLESQLCQLQEKDSASKKELARVLRKNESWIKSLYQEADRLLDSLEYRVGGAMLLKRLRLKKRKKGHSIDQVMAKFQDLKQELKKKD